MNKQELINACTDKTHALKKDTEKCVDAILECITEELAAGGSVKILGFGKFEVKERKARTGINPQDPSRTVEIPASKSVSFSAGQGLKDAVNK